MIPGSVAEGILIDLEAMQEEKEEKIRTRGGPDYSYMMDDQNAMCLIWLYKPHTTGSPRNSPSK